MTLPILRFTYNVKGFGVGEWLKSPKMVILNTLASGRMLKQNTISLKNILEMVICINLDQMNTIIHKQLITTKL